MPRNLTALLAAALLTSGCAYIGSPLPPLANIPARVTDLGAVQRASRIIVHFTVPTLTTEGFPIKPPFKLDLRIGPSAGSPFRAEDWAAQAKQVPEAPADKGLATYELPSAEWTGREIAIAVRAIGANGKQADWSDFVNLAVVPPPARPEGLRTESTAEGVRVSWEGAPGEFRVFRETEDEKSFSRLADVQQGSYLDRTTEFGKRYIYVVQRVVKAGENKDAESDPSAEAPITPEDKFAPAVPSGLRASSAPASVELLWERNSEADLAGYRIYRAVADGPFEKVAEVSQAPSYSDHAVERGKTYRYSIAAFDQSGNESARSAAVEAALP